RSRSPASPCGSSRRSGGSASATRRRCPARAGGGDVFRRRRKSLRASAAARSIHRSPQDNSMRDAEYVSFRPFLSDSDRKNRKIRQHPKYFTFQPFPRRIIGKKVISLRNHSKH